TVEENLRFYAQIYLKDYKKAVRQVAEMIDFFDLQPYRKMLARNLSGGLKQRLSLTCAVVHQPSNLFLDEPTAGIDPVSRRVMWDMLYQLAGKGITLFVTTHYMEEAERCNTIGFIWQGRLVANDTPQRIKETLIEHDILNLKATPLQQAFDILKRLPTIIDVNIYGDELHAVVKEATAAIPYIKKELESNGIMLEEAFQMKPTIEDVFVHLSKEEGEKREEDE
ncbi:MAG: ABC transporter ATP-binding protein, partial [Candidatus Aminicenantes bacterium]|nr:ABC transporter ATP-binding protein [Candidatus Aminicenantes bacterium]